MKQSQKKKDWSLTPEAFSKFLEWLDEGVDSGGQKYLEIRQRLVAYFDRKNCLTPDEFADETLNRVSRRLEEEGAIETKTPAKFCYITARFVFLESLRAKDRKDVPLDDALRKTSDDSFAILKTDEEKETKEKMLNCLEQCTNGLDAANRNIIVHYYYGKERVKIEKRRSLAENLGISMNALTIRACRIRDKLEACVKKCVR
jgi:DNA-directed RNA polymerase specialized sigma24 family protein